MIQFLPHKIKNLFKGNLLGLIVGVISAQAKTNYFQSGTEYSWLDKSLKVIQIVANLLLNSQNLALPLACEIFFFSLVGGKNRGILAIRSRRVAQSVCRPNDFPLLLFTLSP